jgi:uncharacterized membrane protein
MDKFLVVVFPDEVRAFDGIRRLNRLHAEGSVTLYSWTVIKKDASGAVTTLQREDQPPVGIAVGSLVGLLAGVLGGPVGVAVGLSAGSMLGLLRDAREIDVSYDFLSDVGDELTTGRCAVVAELAETWVTPVDVEMDAAGGVPIREPRLVFEEEKAEREAAARRAELERLREEWRKAASERRAKLEAQIEKARANLQAALKDLEARAKAVDEELVRKTTALEKQLATASAESKADIERRIAELREELARRSAKLKQAIALANEALAPPVKSEALAPAH